MLKSLENSNDPLPTILLLRAMHHAIGIDLVRAALGALMVHDTLKNPVVVLHRCDGIFFLNRSSGFTTKEGAYSLGQGRLQDLHVCPT